MLEKSSDEDSDEEDFNDYVAHFIGFPSAVEVYHPTRDDWREVKPLQRQCGLLFVAQGKLYSMDDLGIDIYDTEKTSWANLHSHSFAKIELGPLTEIESAFGVVGSIDSLSPVAVLFVDGELLAIVEQMRGKLCVGEKHLIIRSRGLGGENKEIVWEKVLCPPPFPGWLSVSDTVTCLLSSFELARPKISVWSSPLDLSALQLRKPSSCPLLVLVLYRIVMCTSGAEVQNQCQHCSISIDPEMSLADRPFQYDSKFKDSLSTHSASLALCSSKDGVYMELSWF